MITEDYVSFETARLLKVKGFDGECDLFCRTDDSELIIHEAAKIAYSQGIDDECIILPTLQMAMKWLRDVYHLHIVLDVSDTSQLNPKYYVVIWDTTPKRESYILDLFNSYEEACEEAIKYCLENLI